LILVENWVPRKHAINMNGTDWVGRPDHGHLNDKMVPGGLRRACKIVDLASQSWKDSNVPGVAAAGIKAPVGVEIKCARQVSSVVKLNAELIPVGVRINP